MFPVVQHERFAITQRHPFQRPPEQLFLLLLNRRIERRRPGGRRIGREFSREMRRLAAVATIILNRRLPSDSTKPLLKPLWLTQTMQLLPRAEKYFLSEVFALGDPWIYNEYIDHKDNRAVATNLFRQLLR